MINTPYTMYTQYLKSIFNERVQKITVLGGFSCPNRDGSKGTGGCTFCNNRSFAPPSHLNDLSITEQINHGIAISKRRYKKTSKYIVYFQEYSNTYAPLEKLKRLYDEALAHPEVVGLTIGTRPDCIDEEKLDYLSSLADNHYINIEYGLETSHNESLLKINRCHTFHDFKKAVKLTNLRNIDICAHVILGFPFETKEMMLQTAKEISQLPIKFLKIHQLQIMKDTILGEEYLKKPFKILSKNEYMDVLSSFLEYLPASMVIQRVYGESPKDLLLSPSWGLETSEFNKIFLVFLNENQRFQGKNFHNA